MAPFPPGGPDSDLVRDKVVRTCSPYTVAMVSAEDNDPSNKICFCLNCVIYKVSMSNAKVSIPGK